MYQYVLIFGGPGLSAESIEKLMFFLLAQYREGITFKNIVLLGSERHLTKTEIQFLKDKKYPDFYPKTEIEMMIAMFKRNFKAVPIIEAGTPMIVSEIDDDINNEEPDVMYRLYWWLSRKKPEKGKCLVVAQNKIEKEAINELYKNGFEAVICNPRSIGINSKLKTAAL